MLCIGDALDAKYVVDCCEPTKNNSKITFFYIGNILASSEEVDDCVEADVDERRYYAVSKESAIWMIETD